MKKIPRNFRSGFTMVEVALAIMVLSVGVMGIMAMFPVGLGSTRDAKNDSKMALLAQVVLSDFREYAREYWEADNNFYQGYEYVLNEASDPVVPGQVALLREDSADGSGGSAICRLNLSIQVLSRDMLGVQVVTNPGREVRTAQRGIRQLVFYTRVAKY